jgi:hypothetical protein
MPEIQSTDHKRKDFHPLANIFPLMQGDEFDELVGDIKRRGLYESIVIFEGKIIDGRNRALACEKAGVEPRYKEFEGKPDEIGRYIISANILRRHLKPSERRELLKTLLKMNPEQSNRVIAEMARVSHVTVGAVRSDMQSTGQIDQLKTTVGKDGRERKQATKRKSRDLEKKRTRETHKRLDRGDLPSFNKIIPRPCEEDELPPRGNGTSNIPIFAADIEAARKQYLAAAKPLTKEEKKNEILTLLDAFGLVLHRDFVHHLTLTLAGAAS